MAKKVVISLSKYIEPLQFVREMTTKCLLMCGLHIIAQSTHMEDASLFDNPLNSPLIHDKIAHSIWASTVI